MYLHDNFPLINIIRDRDETATDAVKGRACAQRGTSHDQ